MSGTNEPAANDAPAGNRSRIADRDLPERIGTGGAPAGNLPLMPLTLRADAFRAWTQLCVAALSDARAEIDASLQDVYETLFCTASPIPELAISGPWRRQ